MLISNVKYLKVIFSVLAALLLLASCSTINNSTDSIKPLESDYPHWNFNDKKAYKKLEEINTSIELYKNKGYIAVFDWDGTLYDENIPVREMDGTKYVGELAWYIWMAMNREKFPFPVFPMYNTRDGNFIDNIISFNNYIADKLDVKVSGYNKYIQTSLLLAGMSPENIVYAVNEFSKHYSPHNYAFLPMLDLMQKMINSGYNVWVITASNPYFVAAKISFIERNVYYTQNKKYNFKLCSSSYNPGEDHIAGNALKLLPNGTFSNVYDPRYVNNRGQRHYIVDGEGKLVVVKNLERKFNSSVKFVAGNSGGDFCLMRYAMEKPDTLGIAVEPCGDLEKLANDYPQKIVKIDSVK